MFVKSILAIAGLAGFAIAGAMPASVCASHQQVVCSGNGNGGLLTLGNVLPGALGTSCSGGDVYCCDTSDINQVRRVPEGSRAKKKTN